MAVRTKSDRRVTDYLFRHGKKLHLMRAVQDVLGKKLFFQVINTD
jgi:hypothetical protein